MQNLIYIEKFHIYDIFYREDCYYVICPNGPGTVNNKFLLKPYGGLLNIKLNNKTFDYFSNDRSIIYFCQEKYYPNIKLIINDIKYNITIGLYPKLDEQDVILQTMVKHEDNIVLQWIKYHLHIGFTKIIIYDNAKSPKTRYQSKETTSNLKELLKDYILNEKVIYIDWPYAKNSSDNGQITAQNHCLYLFNNVNYIGFFDIDEYINIEKYENCNNIIDVLNHELSSSSSGVTICSKFFHNKNKINEDKYNFLKVIDYKYRENLINYSRKNICKPQNVKIIRNHDYESKNNAKRHYLYHFDKLYFNHYYFLNKSNRGNEPCEYTDNSLVKYIDILQNENK
tara:strand:+ start:2090 stop:3109 length:1020 start_codon:yes stop_codon:yes gene_type:complete